MTTLRTYRTHDYALGSLSKPVHLQALLCMLLLFLTLAPASCEEPEPPRELNHVQELYKMSTSQLVDELLHNEKFLSSPEYSEVAKDNFRNILEEICNPERGYKDPEKRQAAARALRKGVKEISDKATAKELSDRADRYRPIDEMSAQELAECLIQYEDLPDAFDKVLNKLLAYPVEGESKEKAADAMRDAASELKSHKDAQKKLRDRADVLAPTIWPTVARVLLSVVVIVLLAFLGAPVAVRVRMWIKEQGGTS